MMKSPSEKTDSSSIPDTNYQMNTERRSSWQGQYQFSRPPHPGQYPGPDGQAPPRPPYYPEKQDMYPNPPNYAQSPSTDPNQWQGAPPLAGGMDRYSQPSPAHSTSSQYSLDPREIPNSAASANGMSAAAAAAAAAMAAAAHTAKASPGYQKPQNPVLQPPTAMHPKPLPMSAPRGMMPFHPNYANIQATGAPPNVPPAPQDPGMQNHSSPYQPSPGPPQMNRVAPGPQYPQWGPQQPPNSNDYRPGYQQTYDGQMQVSDRVSFPDPMPHGPMSNASSHDSEESRPKSSARSSSQKISALYEPEEPGRREFIDRVLRYWEEKELPLKHAPMMGGRTLDLYVLYQHVKKKGCMQEVTRSKEWSEISSAMGLGNTSAAGFTLKKQYCKYLYGYECHFERGEPEPQEALARVLEANRKKKQIAEQTQAKIVENSHHDMKPGEDHPHNMMPQHHPYPGQHHDSPYRPPHPGGMPYHQMPNMHHPGYGPAGHNHSVPHGPPSSGPYDPQSGYPPMNVGWPQGGPHYQPHRPPMPGQPRYAYRTNGIPQNSSGQHYLPQSNSVDHGQGLLTRPRFEPAVMPSRPPMPSQMNIPPEVKHPPQPNHSVNSLEPSVPVNSVENQNAVLPNESKLDQKVQDSVLPAIGTTASQPAVPTETTQANSNATPMPSATAATPNEKLDIPPEQNAPLPTTMPPAAAPPLETTAPVVNKLQQEPHLPSMGAPKPATPQPNTQRNTPTIIENAAPSKMKFMRSPEPPKPNAVLSPNYKPQPPDHIIGPQMNSHFRQSSRPYPPNSSAMVPDGFQHSGPYHRPPERAMGPGVYPNQSQYHQSYPPYHGVNQQSTENAYYGQKRLHHPMEQYGPRNKIPRPDPNMYNPMQYRENFDLRRLSRPPHQRNDAGGIPHQYPPYNATGMVQQPPPGIRHFPPPPSHQHPNYPHTPRHLHSPRPRSNSPSVPMGMHISESQKPRPHLVPTPSDSASKYLQGLVSTPHPRPHHSGHMSSSSPYPVGSVEAVVPSISKLKEKTAQNVGVVEAWQIILSLKSGLLAESTWALNALSVLLHDERTVRQVLLSQLPGLLNTVLEHYRFCLQQLFGICKKPNLKNADSLDKTLISDQDGPSITAEKTTSEILSKCKSSHTQLTMGGKQLKYLPAPLRLQNPHSKLPVKIVEAEDHFSLLLDTLWDKEKHMVKEGSIPITNLKFNTPTKEPAVDLGISDDCLNDSEVKTDKESIAELTFEDMLSIPSYIRCFAQNHVVSLDDEENEKGFDIFPKVNKEQSPPVTNEVNSKLGEDDQMVSEDNHPKDKNENVSLPSLVEDEKPAIIQHKDEDDKDLAKDDHASHVQSCLGRFIWSCDVALLEEEAAGFPGNSGFKAPSRINSWRLILRGLEYIFPKKPKNKEPELVLRILCLSNLMRSLSCAHANHNELFMHPDFFKTISGTLLLGHKHRIRHVKSWKDVPPTETKISDLESKNPAETLVHYGCQSNNLCKSALTSCISDEAKEIDEKCSLKEAITQEMVKNAVLSCKSDSEPKDSKHSCPATTNKDGLDCKELKQCEESGTSEKSKRHDLIFASKPKTTFSSVVLNENLNSQDADSIYHDPWWWDCVRQIREDSLVILANLATYLDISLFSDDAMLKIMDALLHWGVCSSADAQDPFPSSNPRTVLSAQSLSIEILTKLSMKEGNVDLILATRPYTRLEKLFKILTIMVGNRKDQILRELSIVLLSNLCNEGTAARAIALQTGAVSNLLSFLEECEETGLNNQRMFSAGQELVNCGTVAYMMQRCALTLLKLAKLEENRPLFLKHHLRLLSLSMSSLLGRSVLSLISAVLFELSREPPNR